MRRNRHSLVALAGLMLALSLGATVAPDTAAAGAPSVDSLLGIDQPDCCHVMDLLIRNRARRFAGHGAPVGLDVLGGPQPGDLELLEVSLVADGALGEGPIFQISFRNTSQCEVRRFQISVVGVLDRITPHSPCRSIRIPCIAAGETRCIQLQLPSRCMTLGVHGGPFAPFNTLVVALDSLDELVECNELNNVAIVKRADIRVFVAATPATAVAPSTTDPATSPATPAPQPLPTPTEKTKPSPIGNIDLDELDLDDAQETAVRVQTVR